MAGVRSAAMTLLLPAGVQTDPDDARGAATVLSDLVLRGAGPRDSHQLINHLDSLGLQRSSGVGIYHTHFSWAAVGPKAVQALAAYADIVRRPRLPQDGFEAAIDLDLQALAGIDDDPRHKLLIALREHYFPPPLGRNPMGEKEDLQRLTLARCRQEHARRYRAAGAILAVAGDIDFPGIRDEAEKLWADFDGAPPAPPPLAQPRAHSHFQFQSSEQTHIGIAYASIPQTDPDYYVMRVAVEILGGGMSGRLFTELREKRGLVYNVWAGYSGLKGLGAILGYAAASNDRAQQTLDCFIAELLRLGQGVQPQEVERARIGLKAHTIMDGESTGGRAASQAHDYFLFGRVRTLEEIEAAIDRVTVEQVNGYLRRGRPGPFTIVVVGPKNLKLP
jgi:predicted Zn-dependent peptidase